MIHTLATSQSCAPSGTAVFADRSRGRPVAVLTPKPDLVVGLERFELATPLTPRSAGICLLVSSERG